jgi:hypothetical protein
MKREELRDFLLSLIIAGVSLYPLYRDDLTRFRIWFRTLLDRRNEEAELLRQVQKEISLLEHGAQ